MRKTKAFYFLYLLLFMVSLAVQMTFASGCATAPPDRVALRSLQVTAKTVETAMKAAGTLYANQQITEDQKNQILVAYATYQKAATLAVIGLDGIVSYQDAARLTQDVQAFADTLIALIKSLQTDPVPAVQFQIGETPILILGVA